MTKKHQLKELPESVVCPQTERAQRFLEGAFDCVQNVLGLVTGGQLTNSDSDLYRAAIVFAGAGLDSSMKQTVRDALPFLLEKNELACKKFEEFTTSYLQDTSGQVRARNLAKTLSAPDSRTHLVESYQYSLTSDSLQSVEQLELVVGALGVNDRTIRTDLKNLNAAFKARNQIVHELDLQHTEKQGDRSRRRRSSSSTSTAYELLTTSQSIINYVAAELCA